MKIELTNMFLKKRFAPLTILTEIIGFFKKCPVCRCVISWNWHEKNETAIVLLKKDQG